LNAPILDSIEKQQIKTRVMKLPLLYKLRQDKTNSYAGLSKSVYVFVLAIFLMSGTKLLAQSFITEWAVNPTVKTLSFHIVTSGATSYSWTAGSLQVVVRGAVLWMD
jgi:hypothetical protein